jgi:hypothetical protein
LFSTVAELEFEGRVAGRALAWMAGESAFVSTCFYVVDISEMVFLATGVGESDDVRIWVVYLLAETFVDWHGFGVDVITHGT